MHLNKVVRIVAAALGGYVFAYFATESIGLAVASAAVIAFHFLEDFQWLRSRPLITLTVLLLYLGILFFFRPPRHKMAALCLVIIPLYWGALKKLLDPLFNRRRT